MLAEIHSMANIQGLLDIKQGLLQQQRRTILHNIELCT
jgi:hypothetical protein